MSGCNNGLPNCITPLPMDASGKLSDYEFLCWIQTNMANLLKEYGELSAAWKALQEWVTNYFDNLDVQQEINNKINDMVQSGEFFSLFSDTVINYSQPVVVSSTSEMINHQKIYVLSSNGHIYQYNGESFVDTNLVYATDIQNYYSIYTSPTDLNNLNAYGTYFHSSNDNYCNNTPDNRYGSLGFCVLNLINTNNSDYANYQIFIDYQTNNSYTRNKIGETWNEWLRIAKFNDIYTYAPTLATFEQVGTYDMNNLEWYGFIMHGSNMPNVTNTPETNNVFLAFNSYFNYVTPRNYQFIYYYNTTHLWFRSMSDNVWTEWFMIGSDTIFLEKLSDTMYQIEFGDYITNFIHKTNPSTNTNNWNFDSIYYKDNTPITDTTSDFIGPIMINNEDDFIGGIHGHENVTLLKIYHDGIEWDYLSRTPCTTVDIYMESNMLSIDTGENAVKRLLKITITSNKINVKSTYIPIINLTVNRCTNGGLFRMYNTNTTYTYINSLFSNGGLTTSLTPSKYNTTCTFGWTNGSITINNIYGKYNNSYSGYITHFENNSNKVYFDTVTNEEFNAGDIIYGEFEILLEG